MKQEKILVPDIGEYSDVDVIEVMVKSGDQVSEEDPLISLETDKATMDIPAPKAGQIEKVLLKVGDKVSKGDDLLLMTFADSVQDSKEVKKASNEVKEPDQAQGDSSDGAVSEDIVVPDIGEYSDVDVIEVMIKAGDQVAMEDPLISLETDKATMEIPAPYDMEIESVTVVVGDKVSKGQVIGRAKRQGADAGQQQPLKQQSVDDTPQKVSPVQVADSQKSVAGAVYASPSVRRMARELGIDLTQIQGTGRKSRITLDDLTAQIKQQGVGAITGAGLDLLADPQVDFSQFGEIETVPLNKIKRLTGANLHRNWVKIPHITLFDETDITDLEAFRQAKKAQAAKQGIKLTPLPFIMKAVAKALADFSNINASLSADGQSLITKKYIHMGMAVDTPKGLVVPVIRNANEKSIYQLATEIVDLAGKAQKGQLHPDEMKGGTFTISSLGVLGTTAFTPIINMPEVAILGVSKSAIKPVWMNESWQPRMMLPLSLSLDHRVIDGAEGARFMAQVVANLKDIRDILL